MGRQQLLALLAFPATAWWATAALAADCGSSQEASQCLAQPAGPAQQQAQEDSALLQRGGAQGVQQKMGLAREAKAPGVSSLAQLSANESLASATNWSSSWGRPSDLEMQHFHLVKELRHRGFTCPDGQYYPPNHGQFEWDCRLWKAARLWSRRQGTEDFVGHRHAGSTSCHRTEAQGYPRLRGCGENIAAGRPTPHGTLDQLQVSNHHCHNMMNPSYNMVGVGHYHREGAKYRDYWTDDFGEWHQRPDQSCTGGLPAPVVRPGCADIDTVHCYTYKKAGFCTVSPNVMAQCKETCNINGCNAELGCSDVWRLCSAYKTLQLCGVPWFKTRCKSTCGLCASGGAAPTPVCRDGDQNCPFYGQRGYCSSVEHIRRICKRTCGSCGHPKPTGCMDHDGGCAYYRSRGYCSSVANVQRQCPHSCGRCGAAPPLLGCADVKEKNCEYFKAHGYCSGSENVRNACRKSCGQC